MRRSLAFYRDLLGFLVVADSGGGDDAAYGMRQLYLEDPDGCNLCFQRSIDNE